MTERLYLLISGSVFALVGLFHLIRLIYQWSIQVGVLGIPQWPSLLAIVVAGFLSIWAFRVASYLSSSPSSSH
ncbi:hypothetical protein ACP6PL_01840 [Dapis sp. BLCC M126]|uniref:hypothetical protein n=1 Tax=Dapis sp. BLCC M126 TaxID=3400189 RepID=UPI003CE9ABCE